MLDLNPRIADGAPVCRCGLFDTATESLDNLAPGLPLPDPSEPFPAPQRRELHDEFVVRLTATVRDLQRRIVRLECANEGHPRAE